MLIIKCHFKAPYSNVAIISRMQISFAWEGTPIILLFRLSMSTGAITGAITTPLDVVKTRLMVQVLSVSHIPEIH